MRSVGLLRQKLASMWPMLDERTRRIMAANEAMALGYGGIFMVRRACGLSRKAITKGIQEIQDGSCPVGGGFVVAVPGGRTSRPAIPICWRRLTV